MNELSPLPCLPGTRMLLLSPHPDDIAYCMGGTVAAVAESELHLLTLFSCSAYAAKPKVAALGPEGVTRVRVKEDRAFCERFGIRRYDAGLPDSSLRGMDDDTELWGHDGQGRLLSEDPIYPSVAKAIRDAIDTVAPSLIFAPAGIVGHADHLLVREAIDRVADPGTKVIHYEDLPYAARIELGDIDCAMKTVGLLPAYEREIGATLDTKVEAMWLYDSQTEDSEIRHVRRHARRLAGARGGDYERYWQRTGLSSAP